MTEVQTDTIGQWQQLRDFPDYEICRTNPSRIRMISSGRVVKVSNNRRGKSVYLNGKSHQLHRVIAMEFVVNPDPVNFTVVIHINGDNDDNSIGNLMWGTKKQACNRRHDQETVDVLPEGARAITEHRGHEYDDLFIHDGQIYVNNGHGYSVRPWQIDGRNEEEYIHATDVNGDRRCIYLVNLVADGLRSN